MGIGGPAVGSAIGRMDQWTGVGGSWRLSVGDICLRKVFFVFGKHILFFNFAPCFTICLAYITVLYIPIGGYKLSFQLNVWRHSLVKVQTQLNNTNNTFEELHKSKGGLLYTDRQQPNNLTGSNWSSKVNEREPCQKMMVDTGVKCFNTLRKKQDKRLEMVEATHSEPWNKPNLSNNNECHLETWAHSGPRTKPLSSSKPGLEQMQTYQECLKLIRQLAEDVKDISKLARRRGVMDGGGPIAPPSLESSRSLILLWAEELNQLAPLQKTSMSTSHVQSMRVRRDLDGGKDRSLERENQLVIEWAKELKNVSEISGLSDKDINRLLCPQAIKVPRLASVLPLLEFFAWSLLSQNNEEDVLKLWLSTKQRALRKPKYIPISVWNWIRSASDSVSLDPFSSHPWLAFSDDNLQVWEGPQRADTVNHPHRFDRWSCVLGRPTISAGRHYWEVELSVEGGWRLGVTDVNAPRKGLFSMIPANGFWTLWKGNQNILWACGEPQTKITVRALPRIVGVYLDFEEGQVSFYDVENKVHIYTFSDKFKGRVVPVFGCHGGDTKISILSQMKLLSPPLLLDKAAV